MTFLNEANSAGSTFEEKVANSVVEWLKTVGLDDRYSARRFQTIDEDNGNRDEDYSDVVVEDTSSGDKFFIECKQNIKDNCITTQFDIDPDSYSLIPVKGKSRDAVDDESIEMKLAADLTECDEYRAFVDFLRSETTTPIGKVVPGNFYFSKEDVSDPDLSKLISAYNKLVKSGEVESDNKEFDKSLIRESTRNMLACALLWRLADASHTWDICHLKDIPYFVKLLENHYIDDKSIPARYIQLGEDNLFRLSEQNPFNIDVDVLPNDILGQFDLKFTPRFGTGSIYMTPRSKIISELPSTRSFLDESRYPQLLG